MIQSDADLSGFHSTLFGLQLPSTTTDFDNFDFNRIGLTLSSKIDHDHSIPNEFFVENNLDPSKIQNPQSKRNSFSSNSIIDPSNSTLESSKINLPSTSNSKLPKNSSSRVTVHTNQAISVPIIHNHILSNVLPIKNLLIRPLYLTQPFLSSNSSTHSIKLTSHSSIQPSAHLPPPSNLKTLPSPKTPQFLTWIQTNSFKLTKSVSFLKTKFLHSLKLKSYQFALLKYHLLLIIHSITNLNQTLPIEPTMDQFLNQTEKVIIFSDHYCCFAIPLYNAGIYIILAQFTILGFVCGILGFSAPSILAITISQSLSFLFATLCLLIGILQLLGFYAVFKEQAVLFRKYTLINFCLLLITIFYSLILIILSFTRHSAAVDSCILLFVTADENAQYTDSEERICNLWTWVQLGICTFLWLLLSAIELYFCLMERVWGKDQKKDHLNYRSIVSAARESLAASSSSHEWQAGSPLESRASFLSHQRHLSESSTKNGFNSTPMKSSRLRNEVEWKELPIESNDPTNQEQTRVNGRAFEEQEEDDDEMFNRRIPKGRTRSENDDNQAMGNWVESIEGNFEKAPTDYPDALDEEQALEYYQSQQHLADDEYYQSTSTKVSRMKYDS
ncbi:hypothetical protein O181_047700 [Austropuccinia psidii MF-1]|uniref:Uncharacterized protein n=1 Tax=Austropuccinia psidii MF-1 TaxID=1389203 RepID=A0A9Q3HNF5_9BASI|nr:hypothetical protein [Austropuccinia psidii MF-1]